MHPNLLDLAKVGMFLSTLVVVFGFYFWLRAKEDLETITNYYTNKSSSSTPRVLRRKRVMLVGMLCFVTCLVVFFHQ